MRQADFLVIDGNSLMHRAFHALPPLDDGNGTYTHAVYGFMSMLLKVIAEAKPRYAAVAFDLHGPTFRHLAYTEYKAGRKPMDDMLRPQFPLCKQLLGEMGVCVLESPGFEADDVLGTLAAQCEAAQWTALLVTGDRDALQLVTNTTHVLYTRRGISDTVEFDEKTVLDTFGVSPLQIPDLKGLMGDASDNIPGVPGIGEKTAVKLLHAYGDLDSILDHAEEQTGKLRERLLTHRALAEKSLWLATIRRDAALTIPACDCLLGDLRGGSAAFERVRFQSLLPRLHALYVEEVPPAPVPIKSEKIIWRQLATLSEISSFAKEATNFPYALVWTENVLTLANAQNFIRIDLSHDLLHAGLSPSEVMEAFSPFFTRPNTLILHGAKDFLRSWDKYGFTLQGACVAGDTALAGALLDGQSKVCTLESLAEGGNDAAALWALFGDQIKALDKLGEKVLYETVELPLMRVLLDMERAGFCVDPDVLHKLGATFTIQIETLRAEIYQLTGISGFNINSPKQLGEVLFDRLGLPAGKKTRTGWSTDADTLEFLVTKHPAIEKILAYRQVTKLNGTYIKGLLQKIGVDGRVHSSFDQAAAVTGRISSNEPNLQNIPVRTAQGREIRRAFIAPPGCILVDADYSQIELRILAHLSGDASMISAFREGLDIHTHTAAEVYGVPESSVTPAMRSASKAVNFGIVYGMSDFGLANNIGVSRTEAAEFIARYFARYPGIRKFMDTAIVQGKTQGYASTLMGRRRDLPELTSANHNTRAFGERAAMNTPVQGAAADIIKLAMVRVEEALHAQGLQAQLILQVHDELIVECPLAQCDDVCMLLKDCMENVILLDAPLKADVHFGVNWDEAH